MPCHEIFDLQSEKYKSEILHEGSLIVSIEASKLGTGINIPEKMD